MSVSGISIQIPSGLVTALLSPVEQDALHLPKGPSTMRCTLTVANTNDAQTPLLYSNTTVGDTPWAHKYPPSPAAEGAPP
jgi:hypothetical protein